MDQHIMSYAFIAPEGGGRTMFVHICAVERANFMRLQNGQKVTFDI